MGILLNKVADLLLLLLWFACQLVGTVVALFKREYNDWNKDKAYAKDCYGNVQIKYIANFLLIKKESKHKFGNPKKPISYVIGLNKYYGTLTYLGSVIDGVLEFFDPGHSLAAAGFGVRLNSKPAVWYKDKVFWLYESIFQVIFFGIIYQFPHMEWAQWPMLAGFIYPIIFGSVLIVYAFLINPIKYLKNKYGAR